MLHYYIHKSILLLFVVAIFSANVSAVNQSLAGGELTYKHVSGSTYEFSLVIYKDCASPELLDDYQTISYVSSSCNRTGFVVVRTSGIEIVRSCPYGSTQCAGGTVRALEKRTYKGTLDITTACNDYKFQWKGFNRVSKLNTITAGTTSIYLEAMLNNLDAPGNSSPSFNSDPINFVPVNSYTSYYPDITDANQDVLSVTSVNPMSGPGQDINYVSPYSKSKPFATNNPITIIPETGEMEFFPVFNTLSKTDTTLLTIKVTETRNGKVIGYVMRDMYIEVTNIPTPLPTLSGINLTNTFTTQDYCIGELVQFQVQGYSTLTNPLFLSMESSLDGATLVSSPNARTVTGLFTWKANSPGKKIITIKLRDGNCPIEGIDQQTYIINVNPAPQISFNVPRVVEVSDCSVQLSAPVNSTVTGGTAPLVYRWYSSSDVNGTLSNTASYTVTKPDKYYLKVTDSRQCIGTDSVTYQPNLIVQYVYAKDSVCAGSGIMFNNLSVYVTGDGSQNVTLTRHAWDFGDGTVFTTTVNGLKSPTHTFAAPGVYNVKLTVTSSNGCSVSETKRVEAFATPVTNFTSVLLCQAPGNVVLASSISGISLDKRHLLTYSWTTPTEGEVSVESIARFFHSDTVLKIKLQTSLKACKSSLEKTFKLFKKPLFTYITPSFYPKCNFPGYPNFVLSAVGVAVDSASRISNKISYSWNNGSSLTSSYLIKIPNEATTYRVKITDTLGCSNDTVVNILDSLIPKFRYVNYFCRIGDIIKVRDESIMRANPILFQWDFKLNSAATILSCSGVACQDTNTFKKPTVPIPIGEYGKYDVTLKIIDKFNCVDSLTYPAIKVNPDTNKFNVSKLELCYDEPVYLSSPRSRYINYWVWDYGDGITDTLYNSRTFEPNKSPNSFLSGKYQDTLNIYSDTLYNVEKRYTQAGFDTVKVIIGYNDGNIFQNPITTKQAVAGCLYEKSQRLEVYPKLTMQTDTTVYNRCATLPTTLIATQTGGNFTIPSQNFEWKFYKREPTVGQKAPVYVLLTTTGAVSIASDNRSASVTNTFMESGLRRFGNGYMSVIKVTDTQGCTATDIVEFDNLLIRQPRIISPSPDCQNKTLTFSFTDDENITDPGPVHRWYMGDTKDTLLGPNIYNYKYSPSTSTGYNIYLKVRGKNEFINCTAEADTVYFVKKAPIAAFSINPDPTCQQDSVLITPKVISAYNTPVDSMTFYWSYSDGVNVDSLTRTAFRYVFKKSGMQTVQLVAQDTNSCFDNTQKTIMVYRRPEVKFSYRSLDPQDGDFVYSNSPIQFNDESNSDTVNTVKRKWYWGDGDTLSTLSASANPVHTYGNAEIFKAKLVIKNTEGCKDSLEKVIDLRAYIKSPNAFSPNGEGDSRNESFLPYMNGIKKVDDFRIYNRWGQLVFESNGDPKKGWDGKTNGVDQPAGIYTYYIKAQTGYNTVQEDHGKLTLLR